jgi:hypothetical protein
MFSYDLVFSKANGKYFSPLNRVYKKEMNERR